MKIAKITLFWMITVVSPLFADYPSNWPWRGVNIPVDILDREKDIVQELSTVNINAVRIHVNYKKLMKLYRLNDREAIELSVKMIEKLLMQLAEKNMTAILGIENLPQVELNCKSKLEPVFWKTSRCIEKIYGVAELLTSHFKNKGDELSAYQFISEPVVTINEQAKRPENWVEIQNKLLEIIKKNDPNRFLVITPGPWGMPQGYKHFEPLPSNKIIYNAHFFQPQQYTHQGIKKRAFNVEYPTSILLQQWDKRKLENIFSDLIQFQGKYNVPVLIGSFSKVNWIKDNNQWLKDSLNVFEKNKWGWFYFIVGANPWKGWDPRYIGEYKTKKFSYLDETSTWKLLNEYFIKNQALDIK